VWVSCSCLCECVCGGRFIAIYLRHTKRPKTETEWSQLKQCNAIMAFAALQTLQLLIARPLNGAKSNPHPDTTAAGSNCN